MPGTPRRPRSSPARTRRSISNKENEPMVPPESPGVMVTKEKRASRVNSRFSVLKVLGTTEAEISPCQDKPNDNAKKRRTSRVSFGNIQTTIFQKDSEFSNNSPSPGSSGRASQPTNLSTLPDDTVFGSPAVSVAGSEAMEITGTVLQPLPALPNMSDQDDGSFASFGDGTQEQLQFGQPVSLSDLVEEDERCWETHKKQKPAAQLEFMKDRPAAEDKNADLTDHDLTADIPEPGNRTRALADHTGAFMSGNTGVIRDQTCMGMEITAAYGGIVSQRPEASMTNDFTCTGGMEFTNAYGGIVAANAMQDKPVESRQSAISEEISGTLSKLREAEMAEREDEEDAGHDAVAMEMTGTFGKILSAISTNQADEEEEEVTDSNEAEVWGNKTYTDGEVTMFTPLSRIKSLGNRRASRSSMAPEARELVSQYGKSEQENVAGEGAENGRRMSVKPKDIGISLDSFLDEIGIRFLTNAKASKRKSSVCPPLRLAMEELTEVDKLNEVLVSQTELGQLRNNSSRLRSMYEKLKEDMGELEEAINRHNPECFALPFSEDQEVTMNFQKQMKLLKKLCRAKAESRWMEWRESAQQQVEDALLRVKDAVIEDGALMDKRMVELAEERARVLQEKSSIATEGLRAQLTSMGEAEAEQCFVVGAFRKQVEDLESSRQQLEETIESIKEEAAKVSLNPNDSMLLELEGVGQEDVAKLSLEHAAIQGLVPWRLLRTSKEGLTLQLEGGWSLQVQLGPTGTITSASLDRQEPPTEFERALMKQAELDGLLGSCRKTSQLGDVLQELSFRIGRVVTLKQELEKISRMCFVQKRVDAGGSPELFVTVANPDQGYKLGLTWKLSWHYPAGKMPMSFEVLSGSADEEQILEITSRHTCGPLRLTRILRELSGS
eukprot:749964-Hanusia_phi.AAC.1